MGPKHDPNFCNCDELRITHIDYRGIRFQKKDLIDMRSIIHQKIEQLFGSSNLWTGFMPTKIFNDMVNFVGDPSGELKAQFMSMAKDSESAYTMNS